MSGQSYIKRTLVGLTTLAFICALAGPSHAGDVPLKAELQGGLIDLDTGVTTNMGGVSAAYNSVDNEFRVFWFDSRISSQNDVYAQRVGTDGSLLGGNVTIKSDSNSKTDTACAHNTATNQYFVTWRYQGGGPGSPGFNHSYGGLVSASGGLLTGPIDVSNAGLEGTMVYNSVSNEYFLEARNFAGGGTAGIYGRRISSTGSPAGSQIYIATSGAPAPAGQVAFNPNANQYLATWRDQTNSNLKGRLVNADGTFGGSAFIISTMFPESGIAASVAYDPVNDQYLVVFSEFCCGGVFGQFVSGAGSLVGSNFTIIPSTGDRVNPFLAYDNVNEAYLVAWNNSTTGKIKIQLLYDDGSLAGNTISVPNPGSYATVPRIVPDSDGGGFLMAWADHTYSPTQEHDIYAQLVAVVPQYLSADTETISASTGGQANFSLEAGSINGGRDYLLLGSVSGTYPGIPLPGGAATLPLNWDVFLSLVISLVNTPVFSNFMGTLDNAGSAAATFDTLGPVSGATGLIMHYAYALNAPWNFASNPVAIEIVP